MSEFLRIPVDQVLGNVLVLPKTMDSKEVLSSLPPCRVVEIDRAEVGCDADLFRQMAVALEFQSYFGHNWDALFECVMDLEGWEEEVILVIHRAHLIRLDHQEGYGILWDCLNQMVEIETITGWPKIEKARGVVLLGAFWAVPTSPEFE